MRQHQRNACPHPSPGLCAVGGVGAGSPLRLPWSTGPAQCRSAVGWWTHQQICLLSVHPPWAVLRGPAVPSEASFLWGGREAPRAARGGPGTQLWESVAWSACCHGSQLFCEAAPRGPQGRPRTALHLPGSCPGPCLLPHSFPSHVRAVSSPSRCFQEYRRVFR